jgi:hypothetical protein
MNPTGRLFGWLIVKRPKRLRIISKHLSSKPNDNFNHDYYK